ncbi:sensor domain-containing diguanylate cyclase [Massilia sp. R2A-15]|uniref:GGDEF domain-containing protein n=1 Tax=Massilia sp. R2A-15 TaxID=3064278 RepID=UPI00273620B9|nr:sensor domain-containing diguanylate cyclase [Massilia sp. R2A-15]WLI88685.1 sensor domain-containing diguanylate cyclase [Massilia sp. R2A-15]
MAQPLPAQLYACVLDESIDAVVVIDQDSTIRYQNAAMDALCGHAANDLLGQPLDVLLPDDVAGKHRGYVASYIARGGVSTVLGHVREFSIRHKSGEMIPIELKAIDLGVHESERFFGAFLADMRPRRREEAHTAALMAQLEQQALTDQLTTLPNRRAYDAEMARVVARSRRNKAPIAVGVSDIDLFKHVNDTWGHPVGDLVLIEVGKALEQAARGTDFVARTGGEEFGMLFPDTSVELARKVAERMREAVEACSVTTPEGECIKVTISIGLAPLAPGGAPEEAEASADAALYQAKERGRNRIETAQPPA